MSSCCDKFNSDVVKTSKGILHNKTEHSYLEMARLLNAKFQDCINDGTLATYADARDMFSNPL
jgi:hypothetical protein